MIKKKSVVLFLVLTLFSVVNSNAASQTVSLPVTIDYPLLQNVIVSNAFTEKGNSATLYNEGGGCIFLALSSPQVSESNGKIELDMQVSAKAGTPLGGRCYTPVEWRGHLVLYEEPSIDPDTWQLSFTTVGSALLGANRQPARITDILWNLIKPHIWSYIAGIKINLMPPVTDLKNFILPLFPQKKQEQTKRMLSSMRPGKIDVTSDSLRLAIFAEVENIYDPAETQTMEGLDENELKRTVAVWENWDGLLVYLITSLSQQQLSGMEKRILTNALLDTRYRFVTELSAKTIQHDIVRQQFVRVWQQLAPVFRRHILRDSKASIPLGYLAFFTSADALLVFDRLGPTYGVEISTNGLIRMARMLHADPELLRYRSETNPDLRKLFEFVPEEPSLPPDEAKEVRDDKGNSSMLYKIYELFRTSTAYAAHPLPSFKEVLEWKVPKTDIRSYLNRVERVLLASSLSMIAKGKVPEASHAMYRNLIPAMAWQESCFRQFVVKGDKLTYLLSYNKSSVGLMQINERVWRGLYNRNRLRWDIRYNANAGSEIAAHYLNNYALRDKNVAKNLDDNSIARLVYAMYNGGPSQLKKFLNRSKEKKLYDSDKLFWEKYSWVSTGGIDKASLCFTSR